MSDQAEPLRRGLRRRQWAPEPRTIAVTSGKGGVGKSNVSLNFSLSLSQLGARVLLLDMDIGMGNIDILLGQSPSLTLADWVSERMPLAELVKSGPEQLSYIAGGRGRCSGFPLTLPASMSFWPNCKPSPPRTIIFCLIWERALPKNSCIFALGR